MRLAATGYAVTAVESAEQALAQLPLLKPHLLITDLQMGGMDGMMLFNLVHSFNPSLPVLILTAHGTIPDEVEATSRGVFSYLTKPFDSKVLLQRMARALETRRRNTGVTARCRDGLAAQETGNTNQVSMALNHLHAPIRSASGRNCRP